MHWFSLRLWQPLGARKGGHLLRLCSLSEAGQYVLTRSPKFMESQKVPETRCEGFLKRACQYNPVGAILGGCCDCFLHFYRRHGGDRAVCSELFVYGAFSRTAFLGVRLPSSGQLQAMTLAELGPASNDSVMPVARRPVLAQCFDSPPGFSTS